jgi:hypothetical protein
MPIADMLAHSPPLPLVLDYGDGDRDVTLEDEDGILLALRHRHRVRHIRFSMPASGLRRLVAVLDGEFIMLEKLYIKPLADCDNGLSLPDTFKAPHVCHFAVRNITYSPGMFHPPPPIPHTLSAERINEFTSYSGPQLWRYAPLCYVYQPFSDHSPWTKDR